MVEQVLHLPFDDLDDSQRRRLNTAISRLRERLGDVRVSHGICTPSQEVATAWCYMPARRRQRRGAIMAPPG